MSLEPLAGPPGGQEKQQGQQQVVYKIYKQESNKAKKKLLIQGKQEVTYKANRKP